MSKRRDENERTEKAFDSDVAVEALLGKADPRPVPPAADEAEIRAAVHEEWDRRTSRRVQGRRILTYGLAASVLVATFAGLSTLRSPGGDAYGELVATIEKQHGTVRVIGTDEQQNNVASAAVVSGQIIETGEDSGLALAWGRGGSFRIDAQSRVQIESASKVRLLAGRIYYDSVSDPMARVAPQAGTARILIETPHGTLRHIGTQFVAELVKDELNVLVREGAVRLELESVRETAAAGQGVRVTKDQELTFSPIDGTGREWRWTEQLSPPVNLDGRSAHDALKWVSRETGQQIRFGSRSAERVAMDFPLRGVRDLGKSEPSKALSAIVSLAGLEWHDDNGVIVVTKYDDSGA